MKDNEAEIKNLEASSSILAGSIAHLADLGVHSGYWKGNEDAIEYAATEVLSELNGGKQLPGRLAMGVAISVLCGLLRGCDDRLEEVKAKGRVH